MVNQIKKPQKCKSNKQYQYFLGIDVAKDSFVVSLYGSKTSKSYNNDLEGISEFYQEYKTYLKQAFVTLEVTGGYELKICDYLISKKVAIHRAHPRQMKRFIESLGNIVKTDNIDAKAIAIYSKERHEDALIYQKVSDSDKKLMHLVKRRDDLVRMRSGEKNKLQAPDNKYYKDSIVSLIKALSKDIEKLDKQITDLVSSDDLLKEKKEVITNIAGLGEKLSIKLLVLLPEIGKLGAKQIAALSGVAPCAKDSGKMMGYRKTSSGRSGVKTSLMVAALSAARSKGDLGEYYNNLIARGKKPMIALVALMRKIIIRANAKIRDLLRDKEIA